MRWMSMVLMMAVLVLASGCASMNPYIPKTTGPGDTPDEDECILVSIDPGEDSARLGDPIIFTVTIRNVGQNAVWMPRNPDLLFTWIYPNGRHDNFLREFESERFYSHADAVLLRPGQQMTKTVAIKTYYFERPGITEFRALLHAGRNTNPALDPFWNGVVESNSYGVLVERRRAGVSRFDSMSNYRTGSLPAS